MHASLLRFTLPFCSLALAASLHAEMLSAKDPSAILHIAKSYGSAVLEKDSEGDPKIKGRIDGTSYIILFYGCTQNKNCDDIQFRTNWSVKTAISMDAINAWNAEKRYGKAFLDSDKDPNLEMTVNLNHGVTRENLDDNFQWWIKAVENFKEEIL